MPLTADGGGHPRRLPFAQEVGSATRAAGNVLDDIEKTGETAVGFYTFGNKDELQPLSSDSASLTPAEARQRLGQFFSADPGLYKHQHTYIAYSIFQLVKQQLHLGDSFTPDKDIPEDASLLNVFVFTDGGEDVDHGFDNSPYEAWLKRHEKRLQVLWRTWKFYPATQREQDERDGLFSHNPADSVRYTVHFGHPTDAYSFSVLEPPADRNAQLGVADLIRLIPSLPGDPAPTGETVCSSNTLAATQSPTVTSTPESTLKVQAEVAWPKGAAATTEWMVAAPGREVSDLPSREHAVAVKTVSRRVLYLNINRPTTAVLDTTATPGRYPVRLMRDSFCDELKRVYPASTFVFPLTDSNQLPSLGEIIVERVPIYRLAISSQDAARPNDPLAKVAADGWHRYNSATRTLRVTADAGVQGVVDVTVLVRRGGKTDPSATGFVSLSDGRTAGGSITVPIGQTFRVNVPATEQSALKSAIGRGFTSPSGDYELVVRILPRLAGLTSDRHKTQIVCQNCDPARFRVLDDAAMLTLPTHIDPLPVSYLTIFLWTAAILLFLWILYHWLTRPRFPEGLVVGRLVGQAADLRRAHEGGLRGTLAVYLRKPLYLDLRDEGRTIAAHEPYVDSSSKVRRNMIGLRPGSDRVHVWCVTKADDARVEILGNPLQPAGEGEPSPENKKLLQVLHSELKPPAAVKITGENGQELAKYPVIYTKR